MASDQVDELKEQGNACVKAGKFEEAVVHYSHAIKLDTKNAALYSNRSFAFLRMSQFYHAMQDAKQTIQLRPDWVKGYFRLGEVQRNTKHFGEAILSYSRALQLAPNDVTIVEALTNTARESQKTKKADEQIPWLGAGLGIIIGVAIVLADYAVSKNPSLTHPILMALLTIAIAMLGYGFARAYRYYNKCQWNGLLEPPVDLFKGAELSGGDGGCEAREEDAAGTSNQHSSSGHNRYTKAQARFRFRKGKA
ncbi:small glutamine-rich tetratricopeptide repeat-containing protein 2 [Nilaparvata lugens]|uniref:small glutamine-rich tetratricopeptide repeat-containing protein 2 n=1 Tax=Nilaparvata lugens TaxID=108931 RepID=UPI000B985431|nr:small glutamine-rich tetratricopeptide repeat-containing protein 2 [Nilaparvata lugens]